MTTRYVSHVYQKPELGKKVKKGLKKLFLGMALITFSLLAIIFLFGISIATR